MVIPVTILRPEEDSSSDLSVINVDDGSVRRLTNNLNVSYFALSPDGRRIAFVALHRNKVFKAYTISVIDIDGTHEQVLLKADIVHQVVWIRGEEKLGVVMEQKGELGLWTVNTDGSDLRQLLPDVYDVAWSPDGEQIALKSLQSNGETLSIVNADGSSSLALFYEEIVAFCPIWMPDSQQLAFSGAASDSMSDPGIYRIDTDGSNLHLITRFPYLGGFSLSPDGRRFAFIGEAPLPPADYALCVIDVDGSNLRHLAINIWEPSQTPCWTPDGEQIVFVSLDDAGSEHLYCINADGTGRQCLTAALVMEGSTIQLAKQPGSWHLSYPVQHSRAEPLPWRERIQRRWQTWMLALAPLLWLLIVVVVQNVLRAVGFPSGPPEKLLLGGVFVLLGLFPTSLLWRFPPGDKATRWLLLAPSAFIMPMVGFFLLGDGLISWAKVSPYGWPGFLGFLVEMAFGLGLGSLWIVGFGMAIQAREKRLRPRYHYRFFPSEAADTSAQPGEPEQE
ncbi:MAG TPA: hypothetical protein VF099_12805 [Ktedonobacterales bacterium]